MPTSLPLADLPPGLYNIHPAPGAGAALLAHLQEQGVRAVQLPHPVEDYLVGRTVLRELAFDHENAGYYGGEILERVEQVTAGGPFGSRHGQVVATLSGGEQQLLAMVEALQLPHSYFIAANACDYLSPQSATGLADRAVADGKRILNLTHHATGDFWQWDGRALLARQAASDDAAADAEASRPEWGLSLNSLQVHHSASHFTLDIPHWHFTGGGVLGIQGDNGSGKSTLADCIAGLLDYAGEINLTRGAEPLPETGYLRQMRTHPTHGMSADEIVGLFADQGRLPPGRRAEVLKYLEVSRDYGPLREGDRATGYRLIISLALMAGNYGLVILDEPTYGLPPAQVADFILGARRQFEAGPLLVISHDSNFLSRLCNNIISMEHGKIR
ncbi:MAG: ATP-binding cassette domain-containing protein [Candidatus Marinimicrobia bacterium]|nr:ATP-binding cassette domain-containing protein [Candidatus Neomarinimicrobiota bacterium]